jgi:hypothetical protein
MVDTPMPPPPDHLLHGGEVVDPSQMPDWERKLYEIAKSTVDSERTPGAFFGTKSGLLTFNKIPLTNNEMNVVITAQIFENVYYKDVYDANKITPPDCYAFGVATVDQPIPIMFPHANVLNKVNPDCGTCPLAKYGTATTGSKKGKACRDLRRLCVIPAGNATEASKVLKATPGFVRLATYGVMEWAAYVRTLATTQRTPLTVVTKMKLVPDPRAQFKFIFEFVSDITDATVKEALVTRHPLDVRDLQIPYPTKDANAQPVAGPQPAPLF